ncbi:hypothetical protein EDD93_0419 [Streptomyces sp. 840.1]|nr:hypothetical protein EDD93_0419 [Streptomyces sp. 840.1]
MGAVNDTVAVALITSLSTLSAAGLAGAASAWVTGRQLRHQSVLAREERAERRATDHREMRREAYEKLLSEADAAYRVLDEGWFALPLPESRRWEAGFAARRALDEAYIRVRLVGPDEVAERGAEVLRSIGREFRLCARIVNDSPDATDSAAELEPSARSGALRARSAGSTGFVAVARRALDGEVSATPRTGPGSAGRAHGIT